VCLSNKQFVSLPSGSDTSFKPKTHTKSIKKYKISKPNKKQKNLHELNMATSTQTTAQAAAAGVGLHPSASLYVGDLDRQVTEALLFDIFNQVGPVASVRICRDAATRRSLGYAYVNFHRTEDAERALTSYNYKPIRGRACRIMWSHRDPSLRKSAVGNIFIKNLAKTIDHKQLFDTFSLFGNILSCKVALNEKGESLGYGFVHYESEDNAQNAIKKCDGKIIAESKVTVTPFKAKADRVQNKTEFTNLYVKNLPEDLKKEKLDEVFGKYGEISSSVIQSDKDGKSKGFAYVCYKKPEDAKVAADAMNGFKIGDKQLFVARHQKKRDRSRELQATFENKKMERQQKYQGVNLYVKNLADNINNERLILEFGAYGQITSARVMEDEHKKSKGFGFVCFATPESATKAVTEMNGKMLEGKPLYVALAQRKEQRRAHLESINSQRMQGGYQGPPMYGGPQGPMFYQGMQPQRMMGYPGMPMMNPRWNPAQGGPGGPQMMGMPMHAGLIPMQGGQRGPGGPQGAGGRGRRPGGRGGAQGGGAPAGRQQQQPQGGPAQGGAPPQGQAGGAGSQDARAGGVRYNQNVRNAQAQPTAGGQPPAQQQGGNRPQGQQKGAAAQSSSGPSKTPEAEKNQPLTIQALASKDAATQKRILGEQLFPLIAAKEKEQAGKITGMLLEMDNSELIHLLESKDALSEKIQEALAVLEGGEEEEADEEEEAE
jgi:polyadenylate-binding protein